jgi:hypothetical protein
MNTRAIAGVALVGAVILVSCAKDQTSTPALLPTEASFARPVVVNYCSFSNISTAARNYFADRGDAVYGLIDAMNTAYKAGGTNTATTGAGFNVLGRLGEAADAGSSAVVGTPAQGSIFANAVLKCMSVAGYTPGDVDFIDFAPSLGSTGLFAVRSNVQSNGVKARGLDIDGFPMFGAEPTSNGTNSNWPIKLSGGATGEAVSPSGKALFYGVKIKENTDTFVNGEDLSSLAFELSTLPTPLKFSTKILAGVCSIEALTARTVHSHAITPTTFETSILAPGGVLSFCPTTSGAISPNLSGLAYATARLANWFSPKPLFALPVRGGGGAGLVDGLSQIGAVNYSAAITWDQPPLNTGVKTKPQQFTPTVQLTVKTTNGTAYRGSVELSVVGNKGSFNISGQIEDTDANGVVRFPDLKIDKAGGYTVTALTGIGNSAPVVFWINGQ